MTKLTRPHRLGALLAAGALAATALAAPGIAAAAPAARHDQGTAEIRGAHLSPDTPGVDVYLTAFSGGKSTLWLSNVGYGDFSSYRSVPAGVYAVSMRAHGASAKSPAALRWTLDAKAGHAYTVAAVGLNKDIHGVVLHDNLSPAPKGHGRVRVIQAANRAKTADVVAKPHTVVADQTRFAHATGYTAVPAGRTRVKARSTSGKDKTTTSVVHIHSGAVESLVLLDSRSGGLQLRSVTDAAGAARTPSGSIDAGGGGMAPNPPSSSGDTAVWVTSAALAVLAVVTVVGVRRRRSLAFARHRDR